MRQMFLIGLSSLGLVLAIDSLPCIIADAAAQEPAKVELIPVEANVIAAREKVLAKSGPKGSRLVAYLDCGSQDCSTTTKDVVLTWKPGAVYQFQSKAKGVPVTQPTVFHDASKVVFQISGLDRTRRYVMGLAWWDYDNGGRTQMVIASSPDGRLVRMCIPAIRLPNYTSDGQLPAEKQFTLPVTFARKGKMQLTVDIVTGANAVISELWIWQLD